jgi:hypothetical protein
MSFISNASHWFARVGHEVKVKADTITPNPEKVNNVIETGEHIAEFIDPAHAMIIASIGSGMEAAWGKICAAVHSGNAVVDGKFLKIEADAAFIQSVKEAIQAINKLKPGTIAVANALQKQAAATAPDGAGQSSGSAVPTPPSQDNKAAAPAPPVPGPVPVPPVAPPVPAANPAQPQNVPVVSPVPAIR